jgi:hypothetical protein
VEPGEQLYLSYNLCAECTGRYIGYGTAEMFRDYGFIERYPQRWYFVEPELQFDLYEEVNAEGAVEYQVKWDRRLHPKKYSRRKIQELIQTLREDIQRIDQVQETAMTLQEWKNVPENEWNLIWEYKDTVRKAYAIAINELVLKKEDRVPIESPKECILGDQDSRTIDSRGLDQPSCTSDSLQSS